MRALITVSLLLAFILTVFPVGFEWGWCRPEFVVLLVIYWSMFAPQYFGLVTAWCVGLCLDLLLMSDLGFNALGMLLISYLSYRVYKRIKNYVLWHQAIWAFMLVGIFQLFSNWLSSFFGRSIDTPIFLIAVVLSGLLWPLLVLSMSRLSVYFRLAH